MYETIENILIWYVENYVLGIAPIIWILGGSFLALIASANALGKGSKILNWMVGVFIAEVVIAVLWLVGQPIIYFIVAFPKLGLYVAILLALILLISLAVRSNVLRGEKQINVLKELIVLSAYLIFSVVVRVFLNLITFALWAAVSYSLVEKVKGLRKHVILTIVVFIGLYYVYVSMLAAYS